MPRSEGLFLGIQTQQQMDPARALAQDSFKELFPDEDSTISFSEFVLFDLLAATNEDKLITAFRLFDTAGDGYITRGMCGYMRPRSSNLSRRGVS